MTTILICRPPGAPFSRCPRRRWAALLVGVGAASSALLPAQAADPAAAAVPVRLEIRQLQGTEGKLNLAIFASEQGFPSQAEKAVLRQAVSLAPGGQTALSVSLPPGTYAVAGYHDRNDNGVLDKNMLGIPSEGVTFSNNPGFTLGAPGFKACAFTVSADSQPVVLNMRY